MVGLRIAALVAGVAFAVSAHAQNLQNLDASRMVADANGDGKVTSAEYQKSRRDFIMSRADRDKNGAVTQAEWNRAATSLRNQLEVDGVQGAELVGSGTWFQMIDANKDASINPTEINTMTADRFARLDANKDGIVDRGEGRLLRRNAQQDVRAAQKAAR